MLGVLLIISLVLLVNSSLQDPSVRHAVISRISGALGYELRTGPMELGFFHGVSISAPDVEAGSRDGAVHLTADRIRITLAFTHLLRGAIVPTALSLQRPRITVKAREGQSQGSAPVKPAEVIGHLLAVSPSVYLERGSVCLASLPCVFEDVYATMSPRSDDPGSCNVNLRWNLRHRDRRVPFSLGGRVAGAVGKGRGPSVELRFQAGPVPLGWVPSVPHISNARGQVEARGEVNGEVGGAVSTTGTLDFRNFSFHLDTRSRTQTFPYPRLKAEFAASMHGSVIDVPSFLVRGPDFTLESSMGFDWANRSDPRVFLRVKSPFMPLSAFKKMFPAPVVPAWIGTRLFPLLPRGEVCVRRFGLDGPWSGIADLGSAGNAGVLSMELSWKNLVCDGRGGALPVEGISGALSIEEGRLAVSGVKGTFGASTFEHGSLDVDSLYDGTHPLRINVGGSFDLGDLKKQSDMPMVPAYVRRWAEAFTSASGRVDGHTEIRYPAGGGIFTLHQASFRFSDAGVTYRDGLPWVGVKGNLSIENGALHGAGISARAGGSRILDASLDMEDLYGGRRPLTVSVAGSFDLRDLVALGRMGAMPEPLRKQLGAFVSVSGRCDVDLTARWNTPRGLPHIRRATVRFTDCEVSHPGAVLGLVVDEAELRVGDESGRRFTAVGVWGRSPFRVSGSVGPGFRSVEAAVSGRIDVNQILHRFFEGREAPVQFGGMLPCTVNVTGKEGTWEAEGDIRLEGAVVGGRGFSMDPGSAADRVEFRVTVERGGEIRFRHLSCRVGKSVVEGRGSVGGPRGDTIAFELSADDVRLEDLGIRRIGDAAHARGTVRFEAEGTVDLDDPGKTLIRGEMAGQGLSFRLFEGTCGVSECDFLVACAGKDISIRSLHLKLGQSPLSVTGRLKGWAGLSGDLAVKAGHLDLAELLRGRDGTGARDRGPRGSPFLNRSHVRLRIAVEGGRWNGLEVDPSEADWVFRGGVLHLTKTTINLPRGKATLTGRLPLDPGAEKLFSAYVKLDGQPMGILCDLLGVRGRPLEGALTMEGAFFAKGTGMKELAGSLTGGASILAEKGVIMESRVIFSVLENLSITNLFTDRPSDLPEGGFYFETIQGSVGITDGVAETDDLVMRSPVFNAAMRGRVTLPGGPIECDLHVQPLGTVDSVVSNIPIVGYILTGKDKTFLIYYFKVTGFVENPDVRYMPLKNLGESTLESLRRLFLTPTKLLKTLSKFASGFSKEGGPLPKEGSGEGDH